MLANRDAAAVLNRDFLEVRGKILEVAATLDRFDRAPEHHTAGEAPDRRLSQLRQALECLLEPGPGRAETVQRIFSLDYDPHWIEQFELSRGRS
jgi:hypothetical protein